MSKKRAKRKRGFHVRIVTVIPSGYRWRPADSVLFDSDLDPGGDPRVRPIEEAMGYGTMPHEARINTD